MIDFSETSITKFAYHKVSSENSKNFINDELFDVSNPEEQDALKRILLKPFSPITTTYQFEHKVDLDLNPLLKISKGIYGGEDFLKKSKSIHQHLKSVSKHPNIKDGDLFVIYFDEIKLNNSFCDAVGIYKIENKESFIETHEKRDGGVGLSFKKGIGGRRLDKACLIVFNEEPFTVFVIDNNTIETEYWQNEFLNVGFRNDGANNTSQFMSLAKTFATEQFPTDFEATKTDQIDLLNRSVDYFKTKEAFDKKEFERTVLQEPGIIKSFRNFDASYQSAHGLNLADSFEISSQVVKKEAKKFKSILKLDANFDIYIHGRQELIERGVEKDGRKFYKIYFEEES